MTKRDHLQAAITYLRPSCCVQCRRRWYHYDDGTNRWYRVRRADLERLGRAFGEQEGDASRLYSRWRTSTVAKEMPADWSPWA